MTKLALKAPVVLEDQPVAETQAIEVRAYTTPESMAAPHRPTPDDVLDAMAAVPARSRRPLQRNPLVLLFADGVLPAWSVRAGQEIARVYALITSAPGGRVTASYGERLGHGDSGDDLAPSLRAAYADRYCPWREWSGAQRATPSRSLADVTLMVCVEELAIGRVSERTGLHHRTVKRRLQASLHWYGLNAGWVPEKNR